MKIYFPQWLVILICPLFFQCASTHRRKLPDPVFPEIDVVRMKESSDEALRLSQENKLDLDMLESKLVEIENRLMLITEELAGISPAKLEELENRLSILSEEFRLMEKDIAEIKNSPFEGVGKSDMLKTFSPNPRTNKTNLSLEETEAQEYKKAADLYYGRKYSQAIKRFRELLNDYPNGTFADNSWYWIGECHFAQGNFAKAIASFQKVLTFPRTEKADDAQLKLGYCYLRMGERNQAAEEFQKVLSLYPSSEFAGRAKAELNKLRR